MCSVRGFFSVHVDNLKIQPFISLNKGATMRLGGHGGRPAVQGGKK